MPQSRLPVESESPRRESASPPKESDARIPPAPDALLSTPPSRAASPRLDTGVYGPAERAPATPPAPSAAAAARLVSAVCSALQQGMPAPPPPAAPPPRRRPPEERQGRPRERGARVCGALPKEPESPSARVTWRRRRRRRASCRPRSAAAARAARRGNRRRRRDKGAGGTGAAKAVAALCSSPFVRLAAPPAPPPGAGPPEPPCPLFCASRASSGNVAASPFLSPAASRAGRARSGPWATLRGQLGHWVRGIVREAVGVSVVIGA